MISKIKNLLFLLLITLSFMPLSSAFADIGPKPEMEFEFVQEPAAEQIEIVSGIMYECEQSDCSDARPLEELGPQRFTCEAASCYSMSYGYSPYHRLEIQFSDGKTRSSNIFETGGFTSTYLVTVRADDLVVELRSASAPPTAEPLEEQTSNGDDLPWTAGIILACVCALAGGLALAGLIIFALRRSARK